MEGPHDKLETAGREREREIEIEREGGGEEG